MAGLVYLHDNELTFTNRYSVLIRVCPAFAVFKDIKLPDESHSVDILKKVGIPQETALIILVNQSSSDVNHVLSEGDKVEIMHLVSGGYIRPGAFKSLPESSP